jgi:uncharacterized tellurite resistance protein B-like protein
MLNSFVSQVARLLNLSEEDARSLNDTQALQLATAVLLFEVMRSDTVVSDTERNAAFAALHNRFVLTDAAMKHLLEQAEQHTKLSNDYFRYTNAINEHFTHAQKIALVEQMWQVAYADGSLDVHENHVIRKVAGLLHVTHGEYIAAKLHAKQAAGLT